MKEVSADKGYLGADNVLATLQRGSVPYIPFKTNSVPLNEALCKVLCHNLCVVIQSMHELNITPEFSNVAA
jgi:hypothetical protein